MNECWHPLLGILSCSVALFILVLWHSRLAFISRPLFKGLGLVSDSKAFSLGLASVSDWTDSKKNYSRSPLNMLSALIVAVKIWSYTLFVDWFAFCFSMFFLLLYG